MKTAPGFLGFFLVFMLLAGCVPAPRKGDGCLRLRVAWGSERLGPRTFGRKEELIFLGREISETKNYSEKIAEEIDEEIGVLIGRAFERARNILTEHRAKLDQIAAKLIEVETIEGEDLEELFNQPVPTPAAAPYAGLTKSP